MTQRSIIRILSLLVAAMTMAAVSTALGAAVPVAAARAACPGQGNSSATAAAQEGAMLCLVNHARVSRGLSALAVPSSLAWAADRKSADIIRCDDFDHEACGREYSYWAERSGYGGCIGENIAYATGRIATPLYIFRLWMHSQGHRENILGSYEDTGIGLRIGSLEGYGGAHVWTQEFGSRNC